MEYLGEDKPVNKIQPLVSVVVPVYQHRDYIVECLEGILKQKTDFNYEIIIGEDHSTDGTRDICIQYAERYPEKIRLFLRDRKDVIYIDGRPTGRFNFVKNLEAARGKFIAECEGDDYWIDEFKLQKQVDFLKQNDKAAWCFHLSKVVEEVGNEYGNFRIPKASKFETKQIIGLGGGFFVTSSIMFRSDAVRTLPPFFFSVKSADFALVLLISLHGYGFCIREFMGVYRIHSRGIFSSNKGQFMNRVKIDIDNIHLLEMFNEYSNYEFDKVVKDVITNHYSLIVRRPIIVGEYYEAIKLFRKYWSLMTLKVKLLTIKDGLKILTRNVFNMIVSK